MKTILILGGYGGVGSLAARLLLQETTANIILAGRDSDKASKAAGLLNAEFKTNRVTWRLADAADAGSLAAARECVCVYCYPVGCVPAAISGRLHPQTRSMADGKYCRTKPLV